MPEQGGDRHKNPPLYVRPAPGDREWFAAFAAKTGRKVHAILREALSEYRSAHSPSQETRDEER